MKAVLALAVVVIALIAAPAVEARSCAKPTTQDLYYRLPTQYPQFFLALVRLWGPHWIEAATVSYGEGAWNPEAENGQYLGTFQCGAWCRHEYGHGPSLTSQAVAAHRYFTRSGWSGWDCKP